MGTTDWALGTRVISSGVQAFASMGRSALKFSFSEEVQKNAIAGAVTETSVPCFRVSEPLRNASNQENKLTEASSALDSTHSAASILIRSFAPTPVRSGTVKRKERHL